VDQQIYFSHTAGVCLTVNNINSKNRKEETKKEKKTKSEI
jgi:hypothetical protein